MALYLWYPPLRSKIQLAGCVLLGVLALSILPRCHHPFNALWEDFTHRGSWRTIGGNLSWLVVITTKEERIVTAASLVVDCNLRKEYQFVLSIWEGECGRGSKGKGSVGILNWIWDLGNFLAFDTTHCMSLFFFFFNPLYFYSAFSQGSPFN